MKNIWKKFNIKRRMVAALAALHYYGNPSVKLKIVGVTGTNGKTTTATLLYRIAMALGCQAGLIGTVENRIGNEVKEATHTTPDPLQLNNLLAEMVSKGCEYVFMEVSSHAVDQNRVAGIKFKGGIFTNLTHDHLDYHKSFTNYFKAKKKFFNMLPGDAFALSNADDEHGEAMLQGLNTRKFFYGLTPSALGTSPLPRGRKGRGQSVDFHGEILEMNFSGLKIKINGEEIKTKLLGKFNAYNTLAVWSACKLLGFDMARVKNIFETIEPPRGRFDYFTTPSGVLVVVDYAHTPDALMNIFASVREIKQPEGRLISVFGCGGDRDPLKRRIMGKIGATNSDLAIFTSDNPRSEDPEKIIEEMKTDLSLAESQKVKTISNRREAIKEAVKVAQTGDVILCAGKGHETYQEIKGVKHHFDDLEEFKKAFQSK